MSTKINTVKDKNNEVFFPITHEMAVRDSSGNTLNNKLQYLEDAVYLGDTESGVDWPDYDAHQEIEDLKDAVAAIPEPDEENLTDDNGKLKLKNKTYDPSNYSGMGRVYLEKNVKYINGVEANYLEQSMLVSANTTYVLQYEFTLASNINIPANCILEFTGGSVKNASGKTYTITGNSTKAVNLYGYTVFNGVTTTGVTTFTGTFS